MPVAAGFAIGGRDDFHDDVAREQALAFFFPEAERLAVAIDAQPAPAGSQFADGLAAFLFGDLAFDQLDPA